MIGRTNAGSGSGGIPIKVIGGTSIPASPKENMVWVYTDIPITRYVLGYSSVMSNISSIPEEDKADGCVWLMTSASNTAYKANITLSWRKAKLITTIYGVAIWKDGKRASVAAFMYQKGVWVRCGSGPVYLYKNGNQCAGITGGWATSAQDKLAENNIMLAVGAVTKKKISYTFGRTLTVKMNILSNSDGVVVGFANNQATGNSNFLTAKTIGSGTTGEVTATVTYTGFEDTYIKLFANNARAVVTEIYVE